MLAALFLALAVSAAEIHVVDGDTIDAGGVRYRVLGVDAPELHGRCLAERRLAARATAETQRLLREARRIEIEPTGRVQEATERYPTPRSEARVLIDGRDLGELLIESGLAQRWVGRRAWC